MYSLDVQFPEYKTHRIMTLNLMHTVSDTVEYWSYVPMNNFGMNFKIDIADPNPIQTF